MSRLLPLWMLIPYAIAILAFLAAFAWIVHVGTNRSDPDLYLGVTGFLALAAALIATLVVLLRLVLKRETRGQWPWLLVHAAALAAALLLAHYWLGAHIA